MLTDKFWIIIMAFKFVYGFQFAGENPIDDTSQKTGLNKVDMNQYNKYESENNEPNGKSSGEISVNTADKRFNEHLKHPCSCHSDLKWEDFGENVYPRYHRSKICNTDKNLQSNEICKFGTKCNNIYHKIYLLKMREKDMDLLQEEHGTLPNNLKRDYYWHTKKISIDCRCIF
ncbi:CLUMA_CG003289, isoform A [Clunio marinus]|uniref:CLUMA_CG003289, isoform A n=1 Tax=Clunio marinus TaxID=568069 RepID=A0A1J1HN79_9DIPT|nr:CLUMA_CG003289, isoform A [Clunio marinus]